MAAPQLPDKASELDFYTVEQLREMAVSIGKLEGRSGWPPATIATINAMNKDDVITFIVRNHYPNAGPKYR